MVPAMHRKAVNSGTALIGDLSRNLKDEENPDQFEINQIAIDGIAIAVNKDNPVTELTSEQITQIFTGEITNWKDLGGNDQAITVIGREAASGTSDGFRIHLWLRRQLQICSGSHFHR